MKKMIKKITSSSPAVILNPSRGVFQIVGRSWLEQPDVFYLEIIKWFDEYYKNNPLPETVFEIRLSYLNTSSEKNIIRLLKFLETKSKIYPTKIIWYYIAGDEDIYEHALRLKEILNLSSDFFIIKEEEK
jgi:hypothetical protein